MSRWTWFRDDDDAEPSSFRLIIEVAAIVAVLALVFVGVKAFDAFTSTCASEGCDDY